jgi:hypothetical protein
MTIAIVYGEYFVLLGAHGSEERKSSVLSACALVWCTDTIVECSSYYYVCAHGSL